METVNTHKSINRTLAVIDGGINVGGNVQTLSNTSKPRLLDQVTEPSARGTTATGPKKLTFIGSSGISFSITSGIRKKWRRPRSPVFFQVWQRLDGLARPHRTRPLTHSCFCITKC